MSDQPLHPGTHSDRWKAVLAATRLLLWLLAALSLIQLVRTADDWPGMDFYQFWATGMALRAAPIDNIYSEVGRARIEVQAGRRGIQDPLAQRHRDLIESRSVILTYSTPFLYTALSVFGLQTYETAYWCYQLLSLACMLLAVGVLSWTLRLPIGTILPFSVILMVWLEPFQSELRVANVNRIQVVLLALFCWVEAKHRGGTDDLLGGVVLGLGAAFKPNIAFVPLLWTWWLVASRRFDRLYPMLSGCALGIASAMAASLLLFGHPRCWIQWLSALSEIADRPLPVTLGNFSPVALMFHGMGKDPGWLLTPLFLLPAGIVLWLAGRRTGAAGDSSPAVDSLVAVRIAGLGVLIYLLSARLVWLHYHVLAIPAFLWIFHPAMNGTRRGGLSNRVRIALGGAALILESQWTPLALRDPYLFGASMCLGATLLYGLLLWDAGSSRPKDLS